MSVSAEGGEIRLVSAAKTHVGLVRKHNEDAILSRPEIGLWVVADGMGGHQAGDVASSAIVETLGLVPPPPDGTQFLAEIRSRLSEVNDQLILEAERRGAGSVIGSTVVALMAFSGFFACLWAGDSRCYLMRNGELMQVSHDHSQVQEMVDAGVLALEEAEHHPLSNVITRAVGVQPDLVLDKVTDRLQSGDIFLLCSDGLCKFVAEPDIARILLEPTPDAAADLLIQAALAGGGRDNVSVILVRAVGAGDQMAGDQINDGTAELWS